MELRRYGRQSTEGPECGAWRESAGRMVATVLSVALLAGVAAAAPTEPGAVAPANSWHTRGGCASRSAVSETRGLRGAVETAWTYETKGTIVDEPLVGGGRILLEVEVKPGIRDVVVLSLKDGAKTASKRFRTPGKLHPTLQQSVLVLAGGETTLEAHRVRRNGITRFWKVDTGARIDAVAVLGAEVYARSKSWLRRYTVGRREAVWERPGQFRGEIAVRGGQVFAVSYGPAGNAELRAIDRASGRVDSAIGVGHHDGAVPDPDAPLRVAVHAHGVVVHHCIPITASSGASMNAAWLDRVPASAGGRGSRLRFRTLLQLRGETVPRGHGWFGVRERGNGAAEQFVLDEGEEGYRILADPSNHADLLPDPFLPSAAGDLLYVGARAIDMSGRVRLWNADVQPSGRAVPARGTLLVVDGEKRLVALREQEPPTPPSPWVDASATGAVEGRAALVSGELVVGSFEFDSAAGTLTTPSARVPEEWPLTEVLALEDRSGRLFVAASGKALLDGMAQFGDADLASGYAGLARDAAKAKDIQLTERLIATAFAHGASESKLKSATGLLRKLVKRNKPAAPDTKAAAKVVAEEQVALAAAAAIPWDRSARLPETAPELVRLDLLRAVLTLDPKHASAMAAVRKLIPEDLKIAEGTDALEILELAEAVRQSPIRRVRAPTDPNADMTPGERTLGIQLHTWRADLQAVQSKQLLVLSVIDRPGSLARALSMGELVCDTLEAQFAHGERRRATRWPLTLRLYSTRDEYRKESGRRRSSSHDLSWSAGHYSPTDEMSSLYIPSGAADFRRVMSVFAHELTHQWLEERCPLFGTADLQGGGVSGPGYWIVEAFASVIEELDFDLRARSWAMDPRAGSCETMSGLPASARIPWKRLFAMTHKEMHKLAEDKETVIRVPRSRKLGLHQLVKRVNIFYDQSTIAASYLFHADDGAQRAKLIDYVGAHYRGEKPDITATFGVSPDELGKRALAWAKSLQDL